MKKDKQYNVLLRTHKFTVYAIIALLGIILLVAVFLLRRSVDEFITVMSNVGAAFLGSALIFIILDVLLIDGGLGNKQSGITLKDRTQIEQTVEERLHKKHYVYFHDVTLRAIIGGHYGTLKRLAEDDCELRFLLFEPIPNTIKVVTSFAEIKAQSTIKQDIIRSIKDLEPLLERDNVHLGYISTATPFAFLMCNPEGPDGYIQVELYSSGLEAEQFRPHFIITKRSDPYWFESLKDQCDILWQQARKHRQRDTM